MEWHYNINDQLKIGERSGYEYFPEDKNYLYEIAQWYPRMAVYSDDQGWQHKQFLGNGEFTLPFGDYNVSITAPADHVVGATGALQNAAQVLTATQRKRLAAGQDGQQAGAHRDARTRPEATKAAAPPAPKPGLTPPKTCATLPGPAPASSSGMPWQIKQDGKPVLCMSYYPKEGNPLWGQYSTAGGGPHHQDRIPSTPFPTPTRWPFR